MLVTSILPPITDYLWVHHGCIQARSQNLEKGGGGGIFWKSEKCANDLDPNFHCSWISFTISRKARKFKGFFRPKSDGLQKKKKRSSPKFRLIFRPKSEIQTFEGGLFSIFHKKSPQNHQNGAILHTSQANGGARAPPPPLATLLGVSQYCNSTHLRSNPLYTWMIKVIFAAFLIALAHLIPRSLVYLAAPSLFLL